MDKTLEELRYEERNVQRLNTALVKALKKSKISIPADVKVGQYAPVSFSIESIPEDLRDLLIARAAILWGEISADIDEDTYCYNIKDLQIDKNVFEVMLMRNW